MERQHPPRDLLASLLEGAWEIRFTSDAAKVLIDGLRVWPTGVQMDIRTIEDADVWPTEFDLQRDDESRSGSALQVEVYTTDRAHQGSWSTLPTSPSGWDMGVSGALRRRTCRTWTPLGVVPSVDLRIVSWWQEIGMGPHELHIPGAVLAASAARAI